MVKFSGVRHELFHESSGSKWCVVQGSNLCTAMFQKHFQGLILGQLFSGITFCKNTFSEKVSALSDILKKGRSENWQAKFNTENNQKHAGEAAPDAHLDELAGIGDDGWIEQDW